MKTGFVMPELIIESIIRDGIQNVRNDPTIIDSVFAQLTRTYASRKYGQTEINKIKNLITKEIAIVFAYHEVDAKSPCFSIMVGSDNEAQRLAHLLDDVEQIEQTITDATQLSALIRVPSVTPTSYDPNSGMLMIPDSVDLSSVYHGMIFKDFGGTEHTILGGINNNVGSKMILIGKNDNVSLAGPGLIKSSLSYEQYEVKGVTSEINLVVGAHSKDALTTKYLYILLKYFILSRKRDLISRNLINASYSGSDFNVNAAYVGDQVFTRFLTVTGKVEDSWRSDKVVLIDNVVVDSKPVE